MKRPFWISSALMLTTLVSFTAKAADEAGKIAVVDMQKAIEASDAGKKAKAKLEGEAKTVKKELETEEAALRKLDEEFKKQSLVMNDEAKAKKQGELQQRFMKFQETHAKKQMEFKTREKELVDPIVEKLRGVISEIAKSKNYALVLEKNETGVLYLLDKDDLTNDVVAAYNKQAK